MNNVALIGRLVRDPELRFVPGNGMAVANFTMAIDKGLTKAKKEEFEAAGKPTADFVRIVVWGKQAENASQYLAKGKLCAIQGSIQSGSYKTTSGETRYTTEVLANRVEFLEWGEKTDKSSDDVYFGGKGYEEYQAADDDDVPF
jgi:single-strand DNA-binding protein